MNGVGRVIVFDNGASSVKIGIAGEAFPRCNIPNLVGTSTEHFKASKARMVGAKLIGKSSYHAHYPMKKGFMVHSQLQLEIWKEGLSEAGIEIGCGDSLVVGIGSIPFMSPSQLTDYFYLGFQGLGVEKMAITPNCSRVSHGYFLGFREIGRMDVSGIVTDRIPTPSVPYPAVHHEHSMGAIWCRSLQGKRHEWGRSLTTLLNEARSSPNSPSPPKEFLSYSEVAKDWERLEPSDGVLSQPFHINLGEEALGRRASLIINVGHHEISVTPIVGDKILWNYIKRSPVGGIHLEEMVLRSLSLQHQDLGKCVLLIRSVVTETMRTAWGSYGDDNGLPSLLRVSKRKMGLMNARGVNTGGLFKAALDPDSFVCYHLPRYGIRGKGHRFVPSSLRRDNFHPGLPNVRMAALEPLTTRRLDAIEDYLKPEEVLDPLQKEIPRQQRDDLLFLTAMDRLPVGEAIFDPGILEYDILRAGLDVDEPYPVAGIADVIATCIREIRNSCEVFQIPGSSERMPGSLVADLVASDMFLTGGLTNCPGFRERLTGELQAKLPEQTNTKLHFCDRPELAAWRGLSAFYGAYPEALQFQQLTNIFYRESGESRIADVVLQWADYIETSVSGLTRAIMPGETLV